MNAQVFFLKNMNIQALGDIILHSLEGEVRGSPKAKMLEFQISPGWWNFKNVDRRVIPEDAKLIRSDEYADIWSFEKAGEQILVVISEYEWFDKFIDKEFAGHDRFRRSWLDRKRQYR